MSEIVGERTSHSFYAWARRWGAIALGFGFFAVLWGIDSGLKRSPIDGVLPGNATWSIAMADAGTFWAQLESSDLRQRLLGERMDPLASWIRTVREQTDIRPTPSRWNNWLGPKLVVGGIDGAWGLSVRPGLLIRVCHWASGGRPDAQGLYHFRDWAYAWRDGFLVVSKYPAYVSATMSEGTQDVSAPDSSRAAGVAWTALPAGRVVIDAADGLPISGHLDLAVDAASFSLTTLDDFPKKPIASFQAGDAGDVRDVVSELLALLPEGDLMLDILDDAVALLPKGAKDGTHETIFAWTDLDSESSPPVPEWWAMQRGSNPAPVPAPPDGVAFEWNSLPGWVRPWLGERLSVCEASDDSTRYWAGTERQMAHLVGWTLPTATIDADLAVDVSWRKAGMVMLALVRRAAQLELIERMNPDDVERELVPYLEMFLYAGEAELRGHSEAGGVRIEGFLALATETSP